MNGIILMFQIKSNLPEAGGVVDRFFSAIFCSTSSRFCAYPEFSGSRDNALENEKISTDEKRSTTAEADVLR